MRSLIVSVKWAHNGSARKLFPLLSIFVLFALIISAFNTLLLTKEKLILISVLIAVLYIYERGNNTYWKGA